MDGTLGKNYLKEYTLEIYPILSDFLVGQSQKAAEYGEVNRQLLDYFRKIALEGKGIRSGLINLSYLACGGRELEKIKQTSIFIEIFQTGILIHDDFMDRSDFRRGIPSVHKYFSEAGREFGIKDTDGHYGDALAVNLGSYSYFLAWGVLINSGFPFERIKKASQIFSDSAKKLVFGQVLDLTIPGNENAQEKDILNMLWTKSGDYSAQLPMLIGATLAGQEDGGVIDAIKNYSRCLGWAFQIQDDLLGAFGNEQEVGKPIGGDFAEGKNTLLILQLRKTGTANQKDRVLKILGNRGMSKVQADTIRNVLEECGARKYVTELGWKYVKEGKKYIPGITEDRKLQEILESLLVYMMERTK